MKIHIVVSSGIQRNTVKTVLKKFGDFDIIESDDGAHGMLTFKEQDDIGMLILDWEIPGIDANIVLARFQALFMSNVPVIVLTKNGLHGHIMNIIKCGVGGIVKTPCNEKVLTEKFENLWQSIPIV